MCAKSGSGERELHVVVASSITAYVLYSIYLWDDELLYVIFAEKKKYRAIGKYIQ